MLQHLLRNVARNVADGFVTGARQTLKEGTLTVGYSPAKNFEVRAEFRYDKSGAGTQTFYRTRAALAAGVPDSDNLTGFALQGIYKFSVPSAQIE